MDPANQGGITNYLASRRFRAARRGGAGVSDEISRVFPGSERRFGLAPAHICSLPGTF